MRNPLRRAFWCMLAVALGAIGVALVKTNHAAIGDAWALVIAIPSFTAIPFGPVWGVMAASLLVAGVGWMLHHVCDRSDAVQIAMIIGILAAMGASFFTVIVALAVRPWKKRAGGR